jgi:hypothetical protein
MRKLHFDFRLFKNCVIESSSEDQEVEPDMTFSHITTWQLQWLELVKMPIVMFPSRLA